MAELIAEAPGGGRGAAELAGCRLEAADPGPITWVAPVSGGAAAPGHPMPEPGAVTEVAGRRALWAGPGQALLLGEGVAPEDAAVEDVSDGWTLLRLTGPAWRDVMARLTPLDLREMREGRTARSLLGHMTAQITPVAGGVEILVMRSVTGTAWDEILRAMEGAAARGGAR